MSLDPAIVARALIDVSAKESPQAVTAACEAAVGILRKNGHTDTHGFLRTVKKSLENMNAMRFATVRIPTTISPERQASLLSALEKAAGRSVDLSVETEPDLLGGAVLRIGDELLDNSIKNEIESVVRSLLAPLASS